MLLDEKSGDVQLSIFSNRHATLGIGDTVISLSEETMSDLFYVFQSALEQIGEVMGKPLFETVLDERPLNPGI